MLTDNQEVKPEQAPLNFYAWYVTITLMLCQTLSTLDAKLPFIMVEAIKRDLNLSDTQIGLITGPAFSLTYAIAAIPIAKLSDRYIRKRVISIAITVWSGFTAIGGVATGVGLFTFSRIGVALGEASLMPAAQSIIASYMKPSSRPKALAVYSIGTAAGTFLAMFLGGLMLDTVGWRFALVLVGVSGVCLALLVALTVREPKREKVNKDSKLPKGNLKSLFGNTIVRNIILGGALMGLSSGAINGWGPAYIMRTFGLSPTETGATFGAVIGSLAIIGSLTGGWVGSWLSAKRPSNAIRMLSVAMVLATGTQFMAFIADSYIVFLIGVAASIFLTASYFAPTYATVQSQVDPNARSFAAAVTLFSINGIGIASGAFVAGVASDLLAGQFGDASLRWALIFLTFAKFWAAAHFYLAARAIDKSSPAASAAS